MEKTDLNEQVSQIENSMPWLHEDINRKKRWDYFFNPAIHESGNAKEFVDLENDPVLNHYKVSKQDRVKRRWLTECMLENMRKMMDSSNQGMGIFETTTTGAIAANQTWQLPLIRKIWPRLFMNQIVPVHAMAQATGKVFTLDFGYGTAGGAYGAGSSIYQNEDPAYSDDPGEGQEPKEINMNITSSTISAISKKLKGLWNIEAEQDLAAYHKLQLEPEVIKMLGLEIEREINRYCLNQLISRAHANTNWISSQPASPNPWSNADPKQYNESIWDAIEDSNKEIKDEVFVDANFLLCGTTFASRLRKLNGFRLAFSDDALSTQIVTGPSLFGSLNNRYIVYEDPFFPKDKALIGHKGDSWLYTGAAFCPYVPVWTTPTIHNTKMQPGRGYLTRFGFKVVNGKFYGTVTVV